MKDINDIKILVFTVDCWSKNVGANTMSSLFSWCKPENLANVYIRPEIPTYEGCGAYFQIRENDVIRSIINRNVTTGRTVYPNQAVSDDAIQAQKKQYNKFREHRPWLLLYAREILWKMGMWKSIGLKDFILNFKPDVIVYAYEGLIHFNRIVRYAVELTGASAIGYFWDDNFTYKQFPGNIGYYIYRYFQRKDIKKSVALSSANFAITPKTKKECDDFFGIDSIVLTKPIPKVDNQYVIKQKHNPIKLLYTGNLGIGRSGTLKIISQAISELNSDGKCFELDVYTGTYISSEEKIKMGDDVNFHNAVTQDEVIKLQKDADVLLFIEDIRSKNSKIARLSFSTKLTDYFAAGKCILAVASDDIAPIEYLRDNDAALVACNYEDIVSALCKMAENSDIIDQYAVKAYKLGQQNHNYDTVVSTLKNTISTIMPNQNHESNPQVMAVP